MTLINSDKTPEQIIRAYFQRQREEEERKRNDPKGSGADAGGDSGSGTGTGAGNPPPQVISAGDFLKLENIVCMDADGNEFERYAELYLQKDIFRDENKAQQNFTPYHAAVHCEKNGLFLPSFALTCNILQALYQRKSDPEIKKVLNHYKDKGNGNGYHAQNSLVDFAQQQVIHYPTAADFNQMRAVNTAHQRKTGSFDKSTLQDELLEDVLGNAVCARYVKQLTGLRDPSTLVEIGKYYGRPAKLWFPWSGQNGVGYTAKQAAWLGCGNIGYFYVSANSVLDINGGAARGVRLGSPRSGAP